MLSLQYLMKEKNQRKPQPQKCQKWEKWSFPHHFKYFLFLVVYHKTMIKAMLKPNSKGKVFKNMEKWLSQEKNSKQCRSHHKKIMEKYGNYKKFVLSMIQDNYQVRRISIGHLKKEIEDHLEELLKQKALTQKAVEYYTNETVEFINNHEKLLQNNIQSIEEKGQSQPNINQNSHIVEEQDSSLFQILNLEPKDQLFGQIFHSQNRDGKY